MPLTQQTANHIFERIAKQHIVVVGDAMLDHYIWGDAGRLSPEAPVPVVGVERDTYTAGGAANVALALRALGASVTLCAVTGTDASAQQLHSQLKTAGVQLPAAFQKTDTPTIVKTRVVVRGQQLCRLDREAPPPQYSLNTETFKAELAAQIETADALILSDYAKGALCSELIEWIGARAQATGTLLALDPKPRRNLSFKKPGLITPNKLEALELAGIKLGAHEAFPAVEVCAAIHAKHAPENLIITLGGEGMLLAPGGKPGATIPTRAKEVFDVSGAGDTVIASLTAALAAGQPLESAAHFANAAAGVVVGKLGTATATQAEILAAFKSE